MTEVRHDEINLLDLWRVIVAQRRLVFIIWIAVILIALAYLLLVSPTYKAEVFLLPPSQKDVQALNVGDALNSRDNSRDNSRGNSIDNSSGDLESSYTPDQVYKMFLQALRSRALRRTFYEKHQVAQALGQDEQDDPEEFFEEEFYQYLRVSENTKKAEHEGFASLSFEGENPQLITQWANTFVDEVSYVVTQRLVADVMSQVNGLKKTTLDMIQSKKSIAKNRREDRIAVLDEALRMALVMNKAEEPMESRLKLNNIAITTDEFPLYMLSPNVLEAEILVLKNRKDDAPFIDGLRDLEEYLTTLDKIKVVPSKVKVVTVDQKAVVAMEPEKPNNYLVLTFAVIFGLILSLASALVFSALKNKGIKL